MRNNISFKLWGRYALFTDPVTKSGGEKFSYHVPTYEAIKGVLKSIYWKPTFVWYVDKIRIMKSIQTQTKGIKPLSWDGGNALSIYTFMYDVEYQVDAHFEWNTYRPELKDDRIEGKHFSIAKRSLEKGGRQDIFLGTRDCQAYISPCEFGEGEGAFDNIDELSMGIMFHSFDYPDETGKNELCVNLSPIVMKNGIISFQKPKNCNKKRFIKKMNPKQFGLGDNILSVEKEEVLI